MPKAIEPQSQQSSYAVADVMKKISKSALKIIPDDSSELNSRITSTVDLNCWILAVCFEISGLE